MTDVTIPGSVTDIGYQAFYKCKDLTEVTFEGMTAPTLGIDAFKHIAANGKVAYPQGAAGYDSIYSTYFSGWDREFLPAKAQAENNTLAVEGGHNGHGGGSLYCDSRR